MSDPDIFKKKNYYFFFLIKWLSLPFLGLLKNFHLQRNKFAQVNIMDMTLTIELVFAQMTMITFFTGSII